MKQSNSHRITVNICGAEAFKLPVPEDEESFYRELIERINSNCDRFRYGRDADTDGVALAKVALYYATMYYRRHDTARRQSELLDSFEASLDSLIRRFDTDVPE